MSLIRITLDHPKYLGGRVSISDNFRVSLVYSRSNNYHVTPTRDMLQDSTSFHVMPPSILRKVSQLFGKNDDSSRPIQDISTDKHQSRDAFPSIPHNSPVGDIPTNILAFRTITKLLSQIQQERPFVVLQAKPLDNQRQELKITNAFATVAVIEHEVVAVVTNRITPTLGLTACVQSPIDKNTSITPSGSLSSKLVSQVWGLLFTQNYRRSDPKLVLDNLPIGEPTIIDAKTMAGLDLVEDDAIKKYAEEYW